MTRSYRVVKADKEFIEKNKNFCETYFGASDMEEGKWEIVSEKTNHVTFFYGPYDTKAAAEEDARGMKKCDKLLDEESASKKE